MHPLVPLVLWFQPELFILSGVTIHATGSGSAILSLGELRVTSRVFCLRDYR